jgi:hypothetical protein
MSVIKCICKRCNSLTSKDRDAINEFCIEEYLFKENDHCIFIEKFKICLEWMDTACFESRIKIVYPLFYYLHNNWEITNTIHTKGENNLRQFNFVALDRAKALKDQLEERECLDEKTKKILDKMKYKWREIQIGTTHPLSIKPRL